MFSCSLHKLRHCSSKSSPIPPISLPKFQLIAKLIKMSLVDIITRVDAICNKYDVEKRRDFDVSGEDPFARFYSEFQSNIDTAVEKSDAATSEKNRASAVALFGEVRRIKARLLEELPKLHKLSHKKVKGLSREELEARDDLLSALKERIESIPDGTPKQTGGWTASTSTTAVRIDTHSEAWTRSGYFQQSEESSLFQKEYEMRKIKQDEGLDFIAEGLYTLKDMAQAMNEEIDRQEPLMDEMDKKADKATSDLKNTNVRLKDTVTKLRSSRNFCLDIILLCVILGIAAYLYNVLK
ncbi:syntaxin-71 [Spinacia oleracea]|uniref:Syntaxin-71 n=1 Tax=Spinacia oleracea TaxID=3562 RepID=A0A9R0IGY5_SPIOL|nr:syntaxin-71-like [Spinacia oleracea]